MNFLKEWKNVRKFGKKIWPLVFYAEDEGSYVHFEPILKSLPQSLEIAYLTSSQTDPLLSDSSSNIRAFYIGSGFMRSYLFSSLKADCMVMTMPDLESMYIKRSMVHSVHYAYIFHSMVSTHMIYRKAAFDHYDSIFCVGPHHQTEIRATEKHYNLKPKQLIEHGYGRLDTLLEKAPTDRRQNGKTILIAPSWGEKALLETCGEALISELLENGYKVILRPHPITLRKWKSGVDDLIKKFSSNSAFEFEKDVRSKDSLYNSDVMISDWSGAALEFSFGLKKPVLFIDVPKKIINPEFEKNGVLPLEESIREKIGAVLKTNELSKLDTTLRFLLKDQALLRKRIDKALSETVYHVGDSGKKGAEALLEILSYRNKTTRVIHA